MIIMKFGGTSVGSASRMAEVLDIIRNERPKEKKIIVLSAFAGTTNTLYDIINELYASEKDNARRLIDKLKDQYDEICHNLFDQDVYISAGDQIVNEHFDLILDIVSVPMCKRQEKLMLAQGEFLSTHLFHLYCKSKDFHTEIINALDFMRLDEQSEPFLERTQNLLNQRLQNVTAPTIITQGFICKNHWEQIDNLQRGGSDYTATIIGAITKASTVQIWTDIDGVRTNDPRIVEDTEPLRRLSYREAAELAYFGAKILHPTCVLPAEEMGVPLSLKYTMNPQSEGTVISKDTSDRDITAIAAKDGITVINIYSHRMLMAYGFMKKIFQVFEDYKTPIDMVTTSEVAVSVTIDQSDRLPEIIKDLSKFAEVKATSGYSIVCIVGNNLYDNSAHVNHIFKALQDTPVRMISMGGSQYNISVLLKTKYKNKALGKLNAVFGYTY